MTDLDTTLGASDGAIIFDASIHHDMPSTKELRVKFIKTLYELGLYGDSAQCDCDVVDLVVESLNNYEKLYRYVYKDRPEQHVIKARVHSVASTATLAGVTQKIAAGRFILTEWGANLAQQDAQTIQKEFSIRYRQYCKKRDADKARVDRDAPDLRADPLADKIDTTADTELWKKTLLERIHRMSPAVCEQYIIELLEHYGLKLQHTGRSGDRGIDAIGTAPLSAVLSTRVAVQVKRYDPHGDPIGREAVALFQRDASTQGCERAVFVTTTRFTEPARRAAIDSSPTVDLIDGAKLCELILHDGHTGVSMRPVVDMTWFDSFEKNCSAQ